MYPRPAIGSATAARGTLWTGTDHVAPGRPVGKLRAGSRPGGQRHNSRSLGLASFTCGISGAGWADGGVRPYVIRLGFQWSFHRQSFQLLQGLTGAGGVVGGEF
jgi:hypothetical protein